MRSFAAYLEILVGALIRNSRFWIKRTNSRLLNVGCGTETHPDFINLDYAWHPGIDVCWDIERTKYPFPDDYLDGIFTEHCLEHISLKAFVSNCREFFRMLKSGGTVRIIVPDGELYLDIYHERKSGGSQRMPYEDECITPMHRINEVFRGYGHSFIYDYGTIRKVLGDIGYVDITRASYRTGRMPALLIDMEWRAVESLYVEAVKP